MCKDPQCCIFSSVDLGRQQESNICFPVHLQPQSTPSQPLPFNKPWPRSKGWTFPVDGVAPAPFLGRRRSFLASVCPTSPCAAGEEAVSRREGDSGADGEDAGTAALKEQSCTFEDLDLFQQSASEAQLGFVKVRR